jgi:hypothetical protein
MGSKFKLIAGNCRMDEPTPTLRRYHSHCVYLALATSLTCLVSAEKAAT